MRIDLIELHRHDLQLAIEAGIRASGDSLSRDDKRNLRRVGIYATLVDGNFDQPSNTGCPLTQAGIPPNANRINFFSAYDTHLRKMTRLNLPPSTTLYKVIG